MNVAVQMPLHISVKAPRGNLWVRSLPFCVIHQLTSHMNLT